MEGFGCICSLFVPFSSFIIIFLLGVQRQSFCHEKLPCIVVNLGTCYSEVLVNVNWFDEFFWLLRDFISLIFTLGSAKWTIICLVLQLKEPGCEILPTLCDIMKSNDLYSGSISDIILWTVSFFFRNSWDTYYASSTILFKVI